MFKAVEGICIYSLFHSTIDITDSQRQSERSTVTEDRLAWNAQGEGSSDLVVGPSAHSCAKMRGKVGTHEL